MIAFVSKVVPVMILHKNQSYKPPTIGILLEDSVRKFPVESLITQKASNPSKESIKALPSSNDITFKAVASASASIQFGPNTETEEIVDCNA